MRPEYLTMSVVSLLAVISLSSYSTSNAVNDNNPELLKSWIAVANGDRGDIVTIDSQTESFESINIETGNPTQIAVSTQRNEFYVRDNSNLYIYDSTSVELIQIIDTNCHGKRQQSYSESTNQLWQNCNEDGNIMVIDMGTRTILQQISLDFILYSVFVVQDYVFVTGAVDVPDSNDGYNGIIVKYSTDTFDEIHRISIGYVGRTDPHLFVDTNYLYLSCQYQNLVYKIDVNELQIIQTLDITTVHGIYGNKNYLYVGNSPHADVGIIYLINVTNMKEIQSFNTTVMGHIHNLMLNCEGNKLFIVHSYDVEGVSVFDIGENGELIGENRIIYQQDNILPMGINRICVYANDVQNAYKQNNLVVNNHLNAIDAYNYVINLIVSTMILGYWTFVAILWFILMIYALHTFKCWFVFECKDKKKSVKMENV